MACPSGQTDKQARRAEAIRLQTRQIRRLLLTVFLVSFSVFLAYRISVRVRLWTVWREMRRAGHPATLDELAEWRNRSRVPPFYIPKAFSILDLVSYVEEAGRPDLTDDLKQGEIRDCTRRYRARKKNALEFLHEAAGRKERFLIQTPIRDRRGVSVDYATRLAIDLLFVDSLLCAEEGDLDGAVRSVCAAVYLANAREDAYTWPRERERLDSLSRLLASYSFQDGQLTVLMDSLSEPGTPRRLVDGVWEDILPNPHDHFTMQFPFQPTRAALWDRVNAAVSFVTGLGEASYTRHLERYRPVIRAMESGVVELMREVQRNPHQTSGPVQWGSLGSAYTEMRVFHVVLEANWLARLRAARVAVAIERFRLAEGGLPSHLSRLVPEYISAVPLDPFDRQPLRYRKSGRNYVVYSVGHNLVDEHGAWDEFNGKPVPDDMSFGVSK